LIVLGNVWAVFRFEWRRALTVPRMAWWLALVAFPIFIVSMLCLAPGNKIPREPWAIFHFFLIPMLVSMLGTFLWTTPAVSAELERESWVYLAVRPGGRTAVLVGKYLAAVTWVLPAALVSLTACVIIASGELNACQAPELKMSLPMHTWLSTACLTCLSCPAYAALYLVIGTLFTKRAMVIAVAYTFIFEIVVSLVPAIINKMTVQYRLRALLVDWAEISFSDMDEFMSAELIGNAPAWLHVSILVGYTIGLLGIAVWLIRRREYTVGVGGDV
jgi:ABC-type transport system involved in multi-copper enzyme maturation permease subunit